ncbi:hypothetical protein [Burkholderia pseudomultivorans]|uniref:hypothetical protein n=1 Tax=Burkholderia pseudomultivorans TaxID=1207504 RepID=UPI000756C526|nr:hypothetical protein [Burkholderia pseudomultivorans]KWF09565.1 hypothetical protein WT55_16715 [Burkholderia pseudomultivorans]
MTHITSPHDATLAAAIAAAADFLRFDNEPGSLHRMVTLGLFVSILSDRIALGFPHSATALKAINASASTSDNPAAAALQHLQQRT